MNSCAVKLVFAAACAITPLVAGPLDSPEVFPGPVPLLNFSPSFAGHPNDLSLMALTAARTVRPAQGVLSLKRSEPSPSRQPSPITHANAANFRFDEHLPDSPIGLAVPQAGTLIFQGERIWSFRKSN